jgi:hypothetical protein
MENGGDAACFAGGDRGDIWETAERVQLIARELIGRRSKVPLLSSAAERACNMTHASVWAQARPLAGRCPRVLQKYNLNSG